MAPARTTSGRRHGFPPPRPKPRCGRREFFREQRARHGPLTAGGIASFGPVDLDPASATYGFITSTPKAGWAQTDMVGPVRQALGVPVRFDTDVNLALFDGFEAAMTRDEAGERLGPPSGRWMDPVYKVQASYYDRPGGRVSIVRQGASTWSTVGHPSGCTHDYVFRDPQLRDQILQWLPPQDVVQVNVLRDVGWGGLSVHLSRTSCSYLVLTARDGDPDPR